VRVRPPTVAMAERDAVAHGEATSWLLVRGSGSKPLDSRVDAGAIRLHRTTRRPTVAAGDVAILYAAVWQAIFAVAEITGNPGHDGTRDRWAWSFRLRPIAVVADLHDAPPVEAAGVFPQSLWRHSHIRLTGEQFTAARALVADAAEHAERARRAPG
jgi:hypothetical protein